MSFYNDFRNSSRHLIFHYLTFLLHVTKIYMYKSHPVQKNDHENVHETAILFSARAIVQIQYKGN